MTKLDPIHGRSEEFPWGDVVSCLKYKDAKAKYYESSTTEESVREANKDLVCPKCNKGIADLAVFYFVSPKITWENLCGAAGWMIACTNCKKQIAFTYGMMS